MRRAGVDFEHLPSKGGHHALEGLVAGGEVGVLGAVVLVGSNDSVVGANLEHMLRALRRLAIDGEGVVGGINGPPVLEAGLERGLDLPVFDQVLDQLDEAPGFMVHLLG